MSEEGRISAIIALLGHESEKISSRGRDHPPVLSKDEIDSEIGADTGSELVFLRDEELVYVNPEEGFLVTPAPAEIELCEAVAREADLHYSNDLETMIEDRYRSDLLDYPENTGKEPLETVETDFTLEKPGRYFGILHPFGEGVANGMVRPQYTPNYVSSHTGIENPERELDFMAEWGFFEIQSQNGQTYYTLVDEDVKTDSRTCAQYIESAYNGKTYRFVEEIGVEDLEKLGSEGVKLGNMC